MSGHPEGERLWRFYSPDGIFTADAVGHTAVEAFGRAYCRLGGLSFGEVETVPLQGPVPPRGLSKCTPPPSPAMVRRVRKNLRRQGVVA